MTNRLGATCWVLGCGVALLVSCGSKTDHGAFVVPEDDGGAAGSVSHRGGTSGAGEAAGTGAHAGKTSSAGSNAGGGSGGASDSALAPKIKITAPSAAADPNVDSVVIDPQVTVVCKATKAADSAAVAVDASTVKIAMLDSDGNELKSAAGTPTKNDDEYSAPFVLTAVPNGSVSFQCSASDINSNNASASIDTLVDHGPEIDIVAPEQGSAHNWLGPMAVEFDTASAPLTKGDKQADVSTVSLTVYGAKIATTDAGGGKYKASVDFTDKSIFGAPPTGSVPVVLTASNNRKVPGKATQSISYNIILDGTGPAINLVAPVAQAVVGRASVLQFSATDLGAGVDTSTVTVKLDDTAYVYSATNGKWSVDASGLFTFQFGAELLAKKTDTQVTVNISAKDKAGNPGMAATLYNLDNQPPIVDMDPPNLYEVTPVDATNQNCSNYFDPVGTDAPNDLETISNYGRFRALVYDNTNTKAGQTDFYFALTDRNSVQIFVQYDTTSPLLADDDGDGVCDEIWTGTSPHQKKPTDKPIPFDGLHIVGLNSSRGTVTYPVPKVNTPLGSVCTGGAPSTAPGLCTPSSDLSVVIHHGIGRTEPVIYAIDPIDNDDVALCTGQTWDVSTAINTVTGGQGYLGWVCVAARAVDNVGNPGVSRPLRICLDDGSQPHRCDGVPPPSCTDSCTPPPHFNPVSVKHD